MQLDAGFGTVATGVSAVVLSGVILGGALIYDAGAVRIRVQEKKPGGENTRLVIPAAAVPVALRFVSDEKLREQAEKLREFLPALEIAARELARQPDFTLIEVRNPREHVRISKRADSLVIDVDSDRETVHVSFPLKLAVAVARRLEAAGPPV
jgi:hypothetical protein